VVSGVDIMVVRELTGDVYFGEPKGITQKDGERFGFNNMCYKESEVRRIAKVAFDIALKRNNKVCSVDKANVLDVSQLWRDVVIETHKDPMYSGITLEHQYAHISKKSKKQSKKCISTLASPSNTSTLIYK